jgi:hypothetical protein
VSEGDDLNALFSNLLTSPQPPAQNSSPVDSPQTHLEPKKTQSKRFQQKSIFVPSNVKTKEEEGSISAFNQELSYLVGCSVYFNYPHLTPGFVVGWLITVGNIRCCLILMFFLFFCTF